MTDNAKLPDPTTPPVPGVNTVTNTDDGVTLAPNQTPEFDGEDA